MPAKFSIDGLSAPQISDAYRQAIAAAEASPVVLSEDSVLDGVPQTASLTDFGPDDFRNRLRRLIEEWNGDTRAYAQALGEEVPNSCRCCAKSFLTRPWR